MFAQYPRFSFSRNLFSLRLKIFDFLLFKLEFFILPPFPRSSYLCTIITRQPTLSALNPFASVLFSLKIRKDYNSYCIFSFFTLIYPNF